MFPQAGLSDKMSYSDMKNSCRVTLFFSLLVVLLFFSVILSVCSGNVSIPFHKILRILGGAGAENTNLTLQEINIITKIRLPRVIMAMILGGSLSLSGFLLQTYFQNPIAGPFVLGISSGAKMTVALTTIFIFGSGRAASSLWYVATAFIGALISTSFILLVARKVNHIGSLLVAGIMTGYITSAVTDFFITFAEDAQIANLHNWSKGSFAGFDLSDCAVCSVIVFLSLAAVLLLVKPIGAYQLGETYARTMGVNTKVFRPVLILLSSILSATVTAFAGPVSFVGIAVPFLTRQIFSSSKPAIIVPASFLTGAVFCVLCDLIARSVFAPMEMSISTVTSVFGAPVVIFMIIKRRNSR